MGPVEVLWDGDGVPPGKDMGPVEVLWDNNPADGGSNNQSPISDADNAKPAQLVKLQSGTQGGPWFSPHWR